MNALRRVASRVFFTRAGQATLGLSGAGLVASFNVQADSRDFFHHSFKTTKDPDAIVDFYSTEDFLQILGIFPFAIHAILAGVEWDAKEEMTNTVWNTMRISFDITEKEETINGADVVTFFNKRERFIQYIPFTRILLWDQVQNYGYRRLPDGTIEVSHDGESFYGPWPVRLLVMLHARYVIWATEKHINSALFGTEDLEAVEHQRSNIPAYVAQEWLATLRASQEEAIAKSRLAGKSSEHQEETLKRIKRLQRRQTTIAIERTPGQKGVLSDNVRVRMEDAEAQAAVRDVLQNVKQVEGKHASAQLLSSLLDKSAEAAASPGATKPTPAAAETPKPSGGAYGGIKGFFKASPPPVQAVIPPNSSDSLSSLGYESTAKKYGGSFKPSAAELKVGQPGLQSFESTRVDEMSVWRTEARSLRLAELLDEAKEAIASRPEERSVRVPEGIVFKDVVEKASHRHCVEMWDAYTRCKENRVKKLGKEGAHGHCAGWWRKYGDCIDNTSPRLVLSMLEAVAKDDPDPNMVRLRR